jgi:phage terminase small subunit
MILTPKQERFCQEYIINFNGTKAAEDAGYSKRSARVTACRLITKANILKRITELLKDRSERTKITQDMVIQELASLGFADMADYAEIEEGGGFKIYPFKDLKEGKTRVIKSIKEDRIMKDDPKSKEEAVIIHDKITFTLHDKIKPLELLGKHLGMFIENIKHSGKVTLNHQLSIKEMKKAIEDYKKNGT